MSIISDGAKTNQKRTNRVDKADSLESSSASGDDSDSDDTSASGDDSSEESRDSGRHTHLTLGERLSQREVKLSKKKNSFLRSKERKAKARLIITEQLAKLKAKEGKEVHVTSDAPDKINQSKRSKHAPTEASSKRKDFYGRRKTLNESGIGVDIGAHRYKPRDPRVSSLSGHLDEEHFERNYAFLNEIRDKEMDLLKKRIAARKTVGKKGQRQRQRLGLTGNEGGSLDEDVQKLKQLQQQKSDLERKQIELNAKHTVKKRLQEEVESGKRNAAHFLKRREMKSLYTEAKFDEIRKRGGDQAVEKVLAKRRKKNKSRDAKGFQVGTS
ncbi:hypothetical protein ACA910_012511 [Epithemia clementina (nom. ined.)]